MKYQGKITDPKDLVTKEYADTKESASNKVTTLSSASTDTQYPSAKAVYDLVNSIAPVYTLNAAGGYTVTIGRVE